MPVAQKNRLTLRLTSRSHKSLYQLCKTCRRNKTRLINQLLDATAQELSLIEDGIARFEKDRAANPNKSLSRQDIYVIRMLTRILETRNFLPQGVLLYPDL